jgi:hypothetical protein
MPLLRFWMNAFIPLSVPGYTVTVPTGVHAHKTAVPLPGIARGWPGNWAKDLNAGYLTDQRGFDNKYGASSRMTCMCEIDAGTGDLMHQEHTSSGTTEVNLVSGAQTGFARADMTRCSYTKLGVAPAPGSAPPLAIFAAGRRASTFPQILSAPGGPYASARVRLVAMAGDPLVGAAADIDFNGTLTITGGSMLVVAFDGMIDAFPAYDCYVSFNGATKTVFTNSPPAGNTVADLLGDANRPVFGAVGFA